MLHLFYGEDDYAVRTLARAVEERYADPAGAFNVRRLDGAEAPWSEIVSACSVLPFLTSHQVVRVHGLIGASARRRTKSGDDPSRPGASPETLTALVQSLPETTVLVLEEGALQSTNVHLKALAAQGSAVEIRSCAVLQGIERGNWVRDEVARRGGAIDAQAATALAERLPGPLWGVSSALDTLIAYAGPGGRITVAAVEELVVPDEDVSAFGLIDAIAARQSAQALVVLHGMLARSMAEEQVMAMLTGRVRDWTLVVALKAEKMPEAEILKRLGWNAGKYRMVARGAQGFARGELPRAYQALVIADEALKSRPADERSLILDLLVVTLAGRGDPDALRQMFPTPVAP